MNIWCRFSGLWKYNYKDEGLNKFRTRFNKCDSYIEDFKEYLEQGGKIKC